ncbi:MAG TPA: chlorophyllide a reductase iron protein subunit X [Myxococcaceae bacterium]|nr:chlorophyllide a reductase iron protein subunit X [Myxococcaceae bacterium]
MNTDAVRGPIAEMDRRLRAEAAVEPAPPVTAAPSKTTQIIAIYGKGGIGKSFTLANLSYMMAQQGKKVLLIGCDPKSDTTSLLFGGKACPTIINTSARKKLAGEEVAIGDVCFKRDGVYAMELGGPEVGRGCGGRGIIHGFETLEKLGFNDWGFDYVLLDFLGDVVCGGFGLPIARDMCQKVIVVGSNDLQSLYVANNVCSATQYFRKLGGHVGVAGIVINKDDGTGEARAFAEKVGIPVLAAIPADEDIRRKSAKYEIIGRPGGSWAPLFEELATNVAEAPPLAPTPLDQDGLLGLFKGDAVGRNVVLEPATLEDLCGPTAARKKSLEVVYDAGV